MDAYEDALRAFDDLIEFTSGDPRQKPLPQTDSYGFGAPFRETYLREVDKRRVRLGTMLDHLQEDGLRVPNDYVWRELGNVMRRGLMFEVGSTYFSTLR